MAGQRLGTQGSMTIYRNRLQQTTADNTITLTLNPNPQPIVVYCGKQSYCPPGSVFGRLYLLFCL